MCDIQPLNITIPQAAAALGCSRDRVYDLINAGELPYVQMGGERSMKRIRVADLVAFNESRTFGLKRRK